MFKVIDWPVILKIDVLQKSNGGYFMALQIHIKKSIIRKKIIWADRIISKSGICQSISLFFGEILNPIKPV